MSSKKLEELQIEIHQKIGKNFLLYQNIEMLLKHLVSINNVSGDHNGITQIVQDKKQKVYKNTMGGLVTQFQKDYDSEVENNYHDDLGELSTVDVAFQFRIRHTSLYNDLTHVCNERNRLTHHFLSDWNMSAIDQCQKAIEHLDRQYQLAKSVVYQLINYLDFIVETHKYHTDVMIAELIKVSVIKKLIDINKQKNKNGWTSLTLAVQRLSQDTPREDINKLNYTYNSRTLRGFMSKTDIFDIDDEKTAKGTKTIYRIKPDINLDNLCVLMPELVVGINQLYKLQSDNC